MILAATRAMPNRCEHGFHATQRDLHDCSDEWSTFVAAIHQAAVDGTIHQSAVRPLIRGRIAPKHIGSMYRRAKAEGLIVDTGEREQSDDVAGRNSDKLDRVYALRGAR